MTSFDQHTSRPSVRSEGARVSPTQRKQDASFLSQDRKGTRASSQKKGESKRRPGTKRALKRPRLSRRFLIVSAVIAVVLVVGIGVLSWNQWLRYDDVADIQGTWQVEGSDVSFSFTDSEVVMTDDVSYSYELDTFHKTITFSFKQYAGQGSYAFSSDRTTLVITETDADTQEEVATTLVKR